MDLPHIRIGHAAAVFKAHVQEHRALLWDRDDSATLGCPNLYTFPTASDTVDAVKQVAFTWDTSCKVDSPKIDLYLYQATANKLVKAYQNIDFSAGKFETQLMPGWWNNTDSTTMYVNILKSGGMAWDTTWSRGPDFKVTYDASAVTTSIKAQSTADTVFENVDKQTGHKVSKAVIAVAVIIPIIVICLLGAVWYYFYRVREKEKLKRWSHALSTASNMEWEKGALPGERASSYGRPSSHYSRTGRPSTHYSTTTGRHSQYMNGRPSTGYGRQSMSSINRPTSSVMMENMAGAGAGQRGMFPSHGEYEQGPTRSSIVLADGTTRTSRISFADRPRPSFNDGNKPHIPSHLAEASYATGSALDDSPTKRGSPSADPRESVDALRDMEAAILIRNSELPLGTADEREEELEAVNEQRLSAQSPQQAGPGGPGGPTVAYGPDQMLAVYAQRGKVNASPEPPAIPPAAATKASRPSAMKRLLSRKDIGRNTPTGRTTPYDGRETPVHGARDAAPSPEPMSMRSYVHLNQGTMSAAAAAALPPPGPPSRSQSRQDDNQYEDAYEGSTQHH